MAETSVLCFETKEKRVGQDLVTEQQPEWQIAYQLLPGTRERR